MPNTTPRQLSDAVKADFDRLIAQRTADTAALDRWGITRAVAGWITLGVVATVLFGLLLALSFGPLGVVLLAFLGVFISPVLFVPAFIVWAVAQSAVYQIRRRAREALFTEYGISVDRSITPHVYAVSTPDRELHPELVETRKLLFEDNSDANADADS